MAYVDSRYPQSFYKQATWRHEIKIIFFNIWVHFAGTVPYLHAQHILKVKFFVRKIKPFRCLLSPFVRSLHLFAYYVLKDDFEHLKSNAYAEHTLMELTHMLSIRIRILHLC